MSGPNDLTGLGLADEAAEALKLQDAEEVRP